MTVNTLKVCGECVNMSNIVVKETSLDEALKVESSIPEFEEHYTRESYTEKMNNKDNLIIVAYVDDKPAGYMIGFDRYGDSSFYCWMTGVMPEYRKMGVLKTMVDYMFKWAKKKGYKKIKIKTRNERREMLAYLVKYGFFFTDVKEKEKTIEKNRILLEKDI